MFQSIAFNQNQSIYGHCVPCYHPCILPALYVKFVHCTGECYCLCCNVFLFCFVIALSAQKKFSRKSEKNTPCFEKKLPSCPSFTLVFSCERMKKSIYRNYSDRMETLYILSWISVISCRENISCTYIDKTRYQSPWIE